MLTTVNLEPYELSLVIRALEMLKTVHPCSICDFTLTPIIEKLRHPEAAPEQSVQAIPSSAHRPIAWTRAEDDIIRMHANAGKSRWELMRRALPNRTDHMIKGRYTRLGLSSATPSSGPIASDKSGYPGDSSEIDPGPTKEYVESVTVGPGLTGGGAPETPTTVTVGLGPSTTPGTEPKPPSAMKEDDWSWAGRPPPLDKLMGGR